MLIGILSLFIDRDAIFLSCLPRTRAHRRTTILSNLWKPRSIFVCVCVAQSIVCICGILAIRLTKMRVRCFVLTHVDLMEALASIFAIKY